MFFPGVRHRSHRVPDAVVPFALAICAIALTLLGWAIFAPSPAGLEDDLEVVPGIASLGSIAYTIPRRDFDDLVVQPADLRAAPRVIASFPNSGSTGYHAHGVASPLGERIAVVSLPAFASRAGAKLSLVEVATGAIVQVEGNFDYFTRVSWSVDGTRLAATRLNESAGERTHSVMEIDASSGIAGPIAQFKDALDVVPVGYSFDSARLFVVVVDQRGSNLYFQRAGKTQWVAELSPGRTRDWSLSPDGSRLAFIDVLAGGSKTYVGRTLTTATGSITTLPAGGDQLGASWMPGSPLPSFGGPGGTLQLTEPGGEAPYIIPDGWSPTAAYLATTVYTGAFDDDGKPHRSLELVGQAGAGSLNSRTVLSSDSGAAFLGWVRNLN